MMKFIVIAVVLIVIVVAGYLLLGDKLPKTNQTTQVAESSPQLEIATDPKFPEVKGQIMAGAPQVPVYPGAILVGSAKTNQDNQPDQGYRIKWTTKDSVPQVMKWYQTEFPKTGWVIEPSNDPENTGEQVTRITKDDLQGNIVIEGEDSSKEEVEIIIEVRENK